MCDVSCVYVTFPCGVLGQVWNLIASIPDHCLLPYFKCFYWYQKISKYDQEMPQSYTADARKSHRTFTSCFFFFRSSSSLCKPVLFNCVTMYMCHPKIVSEYDQEIPQSQTADNPVAPRGRTTQPSRDTRKTN